MKEQVSILWLRKDLRLQDNAALHHALNSPYPVVMVYIFDRHWLRSLPDKRDRRVTFVYETLKGLNDILLKEGSCIYVLYDNPSDAFKTLCSRFDIKEVFANDEYEPYTIERDASIRNLLNEKNIRLSTCKDRVIFEKSEVMKSDGTPYTVYTPYSKIWKQKYHREGTLSYPSEELLGNLLKIEPFEFPSIEDLGFTKVDLSILNDGVNEDIVKNYHETRNLPGISGTSKLGIHLCFGTLSIRHVVKTASRLNESWLNELIWREFFISILFHFPRVINQCFKQKYEQIRWRNNEQEFDLWCKGETGYPIVDAGMRQLNETGWMHNRVRMVVASFLCKHLLIDWRWGEAYFAEKLLDYELASNNGNWQWAAGCGCDAAPYFRIFNPAEQVRKFDPSHEYIKTWIKDYTPRYLAPVVDHDFARKRALEVYKSSLNSR